MTTFDEYKSRVSIMQIAEDLGYKFDKGKGKISPTYVLRNTEGTKIDEIVIKNPQNNSQQHYFDRNYNGGDLISFIKNKIDQFPQFHHNNLFVRLNMILSHYANIPYTPSYSADTRQIANGGNFDINRYEERKPTLSNLSYLTRERGISPATVETFLPFITTVKDTQGKGDFYNIAFPYTKPGSSEITNFELRNYGKEKGFKGMAEGGNKSDSLWIATLSEDPQLVKNVYLFESAIDAMSYYELNKDKIDLTNTVLSSVGGYVSDNQIKNANNTYPHAAFHSGFDNDLNGHIYDIKTEALLAQREIAIKKNPTTGNIDVHFGITREGQNPRVFSYKESELSLAKFRKESQIRGGNLIVHKPKSGFKDFNEVLKNSPTHSIGHKL